TSKAAASVVAALGLLGFCGWIFNIPALTTVLPTSVSMKFNTAVSFVCLGVALWMASDDARERARSILGFVVILIAGLTLAEFAFHANLGIDEFFFRDLGAAMTEIPGRMGVVAAICFLLLGLSVSFFGQKKELVLQQTGVLVCLGFSLVGL